MSGNAVKASGRGRYFNTMFYPWSTSGVFILATLGVGASEYWKYAVLNYMNPILSIVLALFGFGILHMKDGNKENMEE